MAGDASGGTAKESLDFLLPSKKVIARDREKLREMFIRATPRYPSFMTRLNWQLAGWANYFICEASDWQQHIQQFRLVLLNQRKSARACACLRRHVLLESRRENPPGSEIPDRYFVRFGCRCRINTINTVRPVQITRKRKRSSCTRNGTHETRSAARRMVNWESEMDLIRRLAHDTFLAAQGCFTVGVCPVESGNEAARMSAELGMVAARQAQARVLVIETSYSQPGHSTLSDLFNLGSDAPGLGEMLAPPPHNRFDTIHPTKIPGMFVMPTGRLTKMPTRGQLEWVHSVLAKHFQGIVIELPAMGELRAREFCSNIPNAVVLVTHPGCGSWSIRRAVRRLRSADAPLVASSIMR